MQPPVDVEAQKRDTVDSSVAYPPTDIQASNPRHPEPGTRLPIEFRTLSIHVETRVSETGGKEGEKRKRAVKGCLQSSLTVL
jgi:sodium/potassium-transporting ATPase subunit alpha